MTGARKGLPRAATTAGETMEALTDAITTGGIASGEPAGVRTPGPLSGASTATCSATAPWNAPKAVGREGILLATGEVSSATSSPNL